MAPRTLAQLEMSTMAASIFTPLVVIESLGIQFFFCLLPSKMGITDGIIFRLCYVPIPFLLICTLMNEFQPVILAEYSMKNMSIANRF